MKRKPFVIISSLIFTLTGFAEVERPVYSARFTQTDLILQAPSCKNRETTAKDFDCTAFYGSETEAGTGTIIQTVSVTCSSSSDDKTSWCKVGDTQIALGKEITIPFNKLKVYGIADPGFEHPLLSTLMKSSLENKDDSGLRLSFDSDKLPTLTKDTLIEEP